MTRAHPADGVLQAFLDRELRPWSALRLRLHLRGCARCRDELEDLRARGDAVASLIRGVIPDIDAEEAWARFVVRSGGRAGQRAPAPGRWRAASALFAILALIALLTPDSHPPDDGELFAMVRAAQAHQLGEVVRDACCDDHDGGEYPDDGLLTLSLPGERVAVVVIYEDVDRSSTFTPGDIVRYVSEAPRR